MVPPFSRVREKVPKGRMRAKQTPNQLKKRHLLIQIPQSENALHILTIKVTKYVKKTVFWGIVKQKIRFFPTTGAI
ncbi:MAG: hypothetical protein EBY22_12565 [Gammaproteobacteria bacterium]|nr:hypothetical protein [Gammaproteobacteria bacterium]